MKYIASVSFGKDSTAMLITLIEKKYPLDEVVFYDTGMEFKAIYDVRDKMVEILKLKGIKYVELKPDKPFEWYMFEKPVKGRNGIHYGYSWCGGRCRWGTSLKKKAIDNYCKGSFQYVGIAFDEINRADTAHKQGKLTPLVDWKMTEKDCLNLCYTHGISFLEDGLFLYDILDRVSCWCCSNKNIKELKNYYKFLPYYWCRLRLLQSKTDRPFRNGKTVYDLEKDFEKGQTSRRIK